MPRAPLTADADLGLLRGTLDLFILKTLSWGPMHGLAILQWIERTTKQRLQIEEGALYPALHRMEDKGWLDAEWGHTDAGRRAKFYRLTPAGRRQWAAELAKWNRYAEAAALILTATEAAT
jgi:transcriptional regulator